MLSLNLDLNLKMGENLQQELEKFTDEKQKIAFIKQCGGQKKILPYLKFNEWWPSVSQEWRDKIVNLPFALINIKEWSYLAQLTLEELTHWYEEIIARSEKQFQENGIKILSPKVWVEAISKIIPKPKSTKRFLKLQQPIEDDDFNVLLNKKDYNFTPEILEEFKSSLCQASQDATIITEDLFPFLESRKLDPLLILSPSERSKWLLKKQQQELDKKDLELDSLRSQFNEVQQKLHQRDEQLQQQQQQINQLTQDNQEQQQQINQLFEQMKEFRQFMASAKAAA